MRKILSSLALLSLLITASCVKDSKIYDGPAIKHFPEDAGTYFVEENSQEVFVVPVGLTATSGSDVSIEIVTGEGTDAEEGTHFDFVVKSPTVKAGEVLTNVQLTGNYGNLTDPTTLVLKIDQEGGIRNEFSLTIQKFCPFMQSDFVGTAVYTDMWWNGGAVPVSSAAGTAENEIVVTGMYDDPTVIVLDYSDKANFTAGFQKMDTGWIHPTYGMVRAEGSGTFSACDRTIVLGIEYTVDAGSFGTQPATIVMD